MAVARVCMRPIKEVFRLYLNERRSQGQIAVSVGIGKTTVREYLHRLHKTNLSWSEIEPLDESDLERRLGFSSAITVRKTDVMPDFAYHHREMAKPHVTLMLLWTEYRESHGEGAYGYTQFRTLDLGYQNTSTFIAIFRKQFGMSPTQLLAAN